MPTKKQRRRREKTFRHDYELVTYDDEGNEVGVSAAELHPERKQHKEEKAKAKAQPKQRGSGGRKPLREPPVPSWQRSLKRGAVWGGLMFVVVVFFFHGQSLPSRIAIGVLYAAAFVPLTYWIDRVAYRSYQRRSGKSS